MLQGRGDGGPAHGSRTRDWSQEAERTRRRDGDPDVLPSAEALPTPLPRVNFALLGLDPGASRSSAPPALSHAPRPPPLPRMRAASAFEAQRLMPSDAELDALLRRVDESLDQTLELDARPVRPPWLRRRRRNRMWAGVALYLLVGSASFLWFAERAKRPGPAAEPTMPEVDWVASVPAEQLPTAPGASASSAPPAAQPAGAAPPRVRKAERRASAKKAKRARQLAARAKRKKRAARAARAL